MQPLRFSAFEVDRLTDDLNHPLHAYALDGVVCSASDSREGGALKHHAGNTSSGLTKTTSNASKTEHARVNGRIYSSNGDYAEPMGCNVAVFGQSPLFAASLKKQAVRMGCAIYVVLIASRKDRVSRVWTFRYELLTSAELDLDPALHRFKVDKISNMNALRVPVKMWQLGAVTDTNSGNQGLPLQFTISVKMKPFNGSAFETIKLMDDTDILIKVPPIRFGPQDIIFPPPIEEYRRKKQLYMNNAARHKRETVGYRRRPATFGGFATAAAPSQAEFDALKAAFDAQKQLQQQLRIALDQMRQELNAAKAEVAQAGTDVDGVKARVANAEAGITALELDTSIVKESVDDLKRDTTSTSNELKEKLERVEAAVRDVELRFPTFDEMKKNIDEDVQNIKEKIQKLGSELAPALVTVDKIEKKLSDLDLEMEASKDELELEWSKMFFSLEQALKDNAVESEANKEQLTEQLGLVRRDVDSLANEFDALLAEWERDRETSVSSDGSSVGP